MENLYFYLIITAALGSGLIAGIFFAFSNFVMPALARIKPAEGVVAMQEINITVINPLFLGAFMGTALISIGLAIALLAGWHEVASWYLFTACLIYLFGTFVVTIAGNVPLNDKLALVEPGSQEADDVWADYLVRWVRWNHVRTVASLIAAVLFTLALL